MGSKIFNSVLILACFCYAVESATILALFSSLSHSDHLVFRGYVSLLVQSGHFVIVMTPYPGSFTYPEVENIIELDVGPESAPFWDEYKMLMTNTDDYYKRLKDINEFAVKLVIAQLKSKKMVALLYNPNLKFDLVVTEADVPLLYAVAERYQAPHISITTSSGKIHQHEAKGNSANPFLYPDVNSLYYGNLSRWEEIFEYFRYIQTKNDHYNNYLPLCELAARTLFGLKRSMHAVEYDIDFLFIASNPALVGNRPNVPTVIYVDRMHIRPDLTLPKDLQALLDSSPKSVVYFSLGAIQDSEQLSKSILQTLTDAFRELPFLVLWKVGNITSYNKPDNVITRNWFPQQQILAHPKVKAFITHGGPRSIEEAVYYGVPIIGLPTIKSRRIFLREVTRHGAGEILDPYNLVINDVIETVSAVVNNEKYKQAMDNLKDAVINPIRSGPENAVFWTEYLLRHRSSRDLRRPPSHFSLIKYYKLDIGFYILVGTGLFVLLVWYLVKLIIFIFKSFFNYLLYLIGKRRNVTTQDTRPKTS